MIILRPLCAHEYFLMGSDIADINFRGNVILVIKKSSIFVSLCTLPLWVFCGTHDVTITPIQILCVRKHQGDAIKMTINTRTEQLPLPHYLTAVCRDQSFLHDNITNSMKNILKLNVIEIACYISITRNLNLIKLVDLQIVSNLIKN